MRDAPSNPPRRSWFAVWHWPRWMHWACAILAALSPIVYALSYVPVAYLMFAAGFSDREVDESIGAIYSPVTMFADSWPLDEIIEWEWNFLTATFDETGG